MMTLFGQSYAWNSPEVLGVGGVLLVVLLLLVLTLRATGRASEPLLREMGWLAQRVQGLSDGQERLAGGLHHVSEAQAVSQSAMINMMEQRLAEVQRHMVESLLKVADSQVISQKSMVQLLEQRLSEVQLKMGESLLKVSDAQAISQNGMLQLLEQRLSEVQLKMGESLQGSATRTAQSLGDLQQRLETIDKAQANIEKLSGNVLGLQDILSNKQTRGAFGEIQLHDIVAKALPSDAYTMQAKLSNDRRADCLIHLPMPPGPIVVDAKFPLEAYEALRRAEGPRQLAEAQQFLRSSVRTHIRAIAEKYIIEGETADGALMFLPSEAVYAELHANFPDVVREGFAAKVWIVSPTTCMAVLNTMRAVLKDARMREQAGAIRKELGELYKDVERLGERVGNLDRHFGQASKDLEEIKISSEKAGKRARRLDNFDFEELAQPEPLPKIAE